MRESSQENSEQPVSGYLSSIPAVLAAYITSLAVITYPVGFITLWLQIWRGYISDSFTAMYATSLMPIPVVAGRSLSVLYLALFTSTAVAAIVQGMFMHQLRGEMREIRTSMSREEATEPEVREPPEDSRKSFRQRLGPLFRRIELLLSLVVAVVVPH